MTTLVLILAVIGNFREYLMTPKWKEFKSNYKILHEAAYLIYSLGFGVPTIIYFVWKFAGEMKISFLHIVSIYGYSMTIFIPMILLCTLPVNYL